MQFRNKKTQNNHTSFFGKRKKKGFEKETKSEIHLKTVQMPGDVINIIAGYCVANSNEEKIGFFNTHGTVSLAELSGPLYVHKLLTHVVKGEEKEAEAMIRTNPELLFQSGTVMDCSFRTLLNVTPVTAAYGADDVEMLEMMFQYLDKPRKAKAILQIKKTFPEEKEVKSYNFSPIVAAITANKEVEATLEQFRQDFTPGTIEKGKHFHTKILLDAYRAYNDNWDTWSGEQHSLFFRQVIGFVQRSLPACYAQAFCQGLHNVVGGGQVLQRGLKLDGGLLPFYPENLKEKSGLGWTFGVYLFGAGPVSGPAGWAEQTFENLCRAKTVAMQKIMQRYDKRAKPACAIM